MPDRPKRSAITFFCRCVLVAVLPLMLTGYGHAQEQGVALDRISRAIAQARENLDFQDRLPSESVSPPTEVQRATVAVLPTSPPAGETDLASNLPWRSLVQLLVWMAGICALVLVAAWVMEGLQGRKMFFSHHRGPNASADEEPALTTHLGPLLSEADQLAAGGLYAEAMHRLLLDAVAVLRGQADGSISPSLTSREILRAVTLPPVEHGALRTIVERVEETWFGARNACVEDYRALRSCFAQLSSLRAGTD